MSIEEHANVRRREALAAEAVEVSHQHRQHQHHHHHHPYQQHHRYQEYHAYQAGPSASQARGIEGELEAGTEVDREEEEEEEERVEVGEVEDFTSILLPVDSKERRVVLRRVSLACLQSDS